MMVERMGGISVWVGSSPTTCLFLGELSVISMFVFFEDEKEKQNAERKSLEVKKNLSKEYIDL